MFWAIRGGGGGSWGVITETTFETFETFNVAKHTVGIIAPTNDSTGDLMTIHAEHIFDWDSVNAGQYAYVYPPSIPTNGLVANPAYGTSSNGLGLLTYFANQTEDQAIALMKPLLDDARAQGFEVVNETVVVELANDAVYAADNAAGVSTIMGSRLFSSDAYKTNAAGIGAAYQQLIEQGATQCAIFFVLFSAICELMYLLLESVVTSSPVVRIPYPIHISSWLMRTVS